MDHFNLVIHVILMSNEPELNTPVRPQRFVVGPQDLASSISSETGDEFPASAGYSTHGCTDGDRRSRVLQPLLGPGELSVGVTVDISHTAPRRWAQKSPQPHATQVAKESSFFLKSVLPIPAEKLVEAGTSARLSRVNGCKAARPNELVEVPPCSARRMTGATKRGVDHDDLRKSLRSRV